MNTELKFKAWNGYRKVMADYVSAIQNGDTQGTPSSVNVIVNGENETWEIKNDDVKLLPFTGLKDVNGKKIYEGDIVSVFNDDGNYYNDVIKWCIEYNYPAFDLKYHSYLYESNALSEIMNAGVENIKVIGNVHENPELLKG